MFRRLIVSVFACLLMAEANGAAPRYKVVILHRGGFDSGAHGVSSGQQVGDQGGRAVLWSGTPESCIDLNPSEFSVGVALGISDGQQVGYGRGIDSGYLDHALLWSGTGESCVDLHPSGFDMSLALGVSQGQQVGCGYVEAHYGQYHYWNTHALLWSGTAESCVDLHPSGFAHSVANAISGGEAVGWGRIDDGGDPTTGLLHALLWSTTTGSCIDLNPAEGVYSLAYGVCGGQQVGGTWYPPRHALLWSGTAETCVDLHPSGFGESCAYATSGEKQVGYGYGVVTGSIYGALVWSGTAESYVDLHRFLPPGYTRSMAKGIDAGGNIVGTAYTFDGHRRAVMWVPLPNVVPPVVSTSPATDLTKQSATLNGILTDDGGEACQYRFRYKEEKGDYIYTSWTGSVTSGQSFSETISDLAHSKTYYFNAQARNSAGESEWGNQQIFGKPKEFMITFDDGPLPDATESIVAQLNGIILDDGKPVKAGFFMVGCNGCQDSGAPMPRYGWLMPGDPWKTKGSVRDYGSMVRHVALVPAEHVIGNHTQHHMMFWPWIAKQDVEAEITACEKELKLALDPISRPLDMVFRPPYFAYNPAVERATRSLGFKIIMGAGGGRRSAVDASWWISSVEDIEQNATDLILNWKGNEPCVLVFHDASPITPYNIAEIIRYLREEQGFTLVHFDPTRISDPSSEDLVIQELRGEASGPIDLVVIGPDGLVLSKEENLFPNAFYEELNIDIGSIDIDDLFVIEYPEPGFYEIYVIPESSALPGDKYSLDVYYDEELVFSEDRAQVSDIPSAPYRFPLR